MSSLLIQEVPLMVLPTLATKIGLNEAMFLQQLHYWVDRSNHEMDGRKWIYNTIEDWCKQFPFWSRRTLVRIISNLEKQLLILAGNYNAKGFDRTKWYTVNYERLAELEQESTPPSPTSGGKHTDNGTGGNTPDSSTPSLIVEPQENPVLISESNAKSVSGTSIVPNWHNEENQGLATAPIGGTTIVPKWPNEERRGRGGDFSSIGDILGTLMMPNCPNAFGQNGTMDSAILARPIPENNNREELQRITTTTQQPASQPRKEDSQAPTQLELLLLSAHDYGLTEVSVRQYILQYGEELVLREFSMLKRLIETKKPIQNPAGWFRRALEQQYVDSKANYEKIQQEKKAAAEAKNRERMEHYRRLDEEKRRQERVQPPIDPSSPFFGILQRIRARQEAVPVM